MMKQWWLERPATQQPCPQGTGKSSRYNISSRTLHVLEAVWQNLSQNMGDIKRKVFLIPAIFPRGLFTVSLDGLSERETTCNPLWRLLTPKWSQIINIVIKLIKPMAAIIRK